MRRVSMILIWMLCAIFPLMAQTRVLTGAEQTEKWLPLLRNKRVAVLANHTSMVGDEHLVDMLVRERVDLAGIISPEHGFRGTADAGEKVANSVDERTGIPVWSLYGAHPRRLSPEQLQQFDVIVVDMQDVGLRFYTYYITMLDAMAMCADCNYPIIVLDRPNPNGMYVDGPILDMRYKSGVGALPIPVVHGLTMGEIARMAVGEGWSKPVELTVIPCANYTHSMRYTLPVAPSPNLRTQHAVYLYPSTCLFEGTICSLGRGTDWPFEVYGHPDMQGCAFASFRSRRKESSAAQSGVSRCRFARIARRGDYRCGVQSRTCYRRVSQTRCGREIFYAVFRKTRRCRVCARDDLRRCFGCRDSRPWAGRFAAIHEIAPKISALRRITTG